MRGGFGRSRNNGRFLFLPNVLGGGVDGFDESDEPFIKGTAFNGNKSEANTKKKENNF